MFKQKLSVKIAKFRSFRMIEHIPKKNENAIFSSIVTRGNSQIVGDLSNRARCRVNLFKTKLLSRILYGKGPNILHLRKFLFK